MRINQQHNKLGTTFIIFKKKTGKDICVPNENNKVLHSTVVSNLINHNILITNQRLQYMGIKDDPLCTFCKTHVETTGHLLWDCSITKDFLK